MTIFVWTIIVILGILFVLGSLILLLCLCQRSNLTALESNAQENRSDNEKAKKNRSFSVDASECTNTGITSKPSLALSAQEYDIQIQQAPRRSNTAFIRRKESLYQKILKRNSRLSLSSDNVSRADNSTPLTHSKFNDSNEIIFSNQHHQDLEEIRETLRETEMASIDIPEDKNAFENILSNDIQQIQQIGTSFETPNIPGALSPTFSPESYKISKEYSWDLKHSRFHTFPENEKDSKNEKSFLMKTKENPANDEREYLSDSEVISSYHSLVIEMK